MKGTVLFFLIGLHLSSSLYEVPLQLLKYTVTKIISRNNIDGDCIEDLSLLISDLFEMKMWALKMFDATGKPNSGITNGNVQTFGDYDLCLSIKQNTNRRTIEGQYCTALVRIDDRILSEDILSLKSKYYDKNVEKIKLPEPLNDIKNVSGVVGVCVPKSCSPGDLETLAYQIESTLKIPIRLNFLDVLLSDNSISLSSYIMRMTSPVLVPIYLNSQFRLAENMSCGLVMMGLLICGSTIYDVYLQGFGQYPLLKIFSVKTNMRKLLHRCEDKKLSCLNGIRVISCFWVMLGHTSIASVLTSRNPLHVVTELEGSFNPVSTIVLSFYYANDAFFLLGGLLASYIYLKKSEKISVSLFSFYSNRYIRIIPMMGISLLVQLSLLYILVDGPYRKISINLAEKSSNIWPSVLSSTANIFQHDQSVIHHLWYLSCDNQMYLVTPVFLFFIRKHPKRVTVGMIVTFLLAIVYTFAVTVVKNFTIYDWGEDFRYYLVFSTIHHLPSWIIGVFCGYLLQFRNVKIHKNLNMFLLSMSFSLLVELIINQVSFLEGESSVYSSALWNSLARPAWCLALCYIIFSCATGNGGFINSFLSHYVFEVLGKLTYSIYILHPGIIAGLLINARQSLFFSNRQLLKNFIELCMFTLPLSLLTYLAFEAPIISLKDYALKRQKIKAEKKKSS